VSLSAGAPWIESLYIFQQGDDPQHWAKATVVWLQTSEILDFIPIEHVCSDSKLLFSTNCLHPT